MFVSKECKHYETLRQRRGEMETFRGFFPRHKEHFATQFVQEIRKQGRLSGVKVRVILPLVLQVYRYLSDFDAALPETVLKNLSKLKTLDVEPDRLMRKLLTSLSLRYLDDYKDDPELLGHLSLLTFYFQAVVDCVEKKIQGVESRPIGYAPMRREEIESALHKGATVRLFSIYKGIPIRFKGVVKRVEEGRAELVVPKEKGVVAEWEGQLVKYDDEKNDKRVVAMRVRRVGYSHKHAFIEVDGFSWTENFLSRRKSVRVMIDKPIKATIKSINKQLELDVIDLSVHGICLEGSIAGGLPSSEHVEVVVPIPQEEGKTRNLRMRGVLRYVSQHDGLRRRYHILLHHDPQKEQIIASFVAREEMRLLREIKETAANK